MPVQITNIIAKITDKWKNFTKGQKTKIIVIAALVILSLGATIYLYTKPVYTSFRANRPSAEISALRDLFDANAIKYQVKDNATSIDVLAAHKNDAIMLLAANPEVAGKDFGLDDALALMGMGTTETEKGMVKTDYANAKVEQLVKGVNGVKSAKVSLAMSDESSRLFPSTSKVTCAIVIEYDGVATKAVGKMIAQLASYAVQGLEPENVCVSSQDGVIYGNSQDEFSDLSERQQNEEMQKRALSSKAESLLAGNFDIIVAEAYIPFVWDTTESKQTIIKSPIDGSTKGVTLSQNTEDSTVKEGVTGDLVGLEANDLEQTPTYPTGSNSTGSAESSKNNVVYGYNTEEKTSVAATGVADLSNASIAATVYTNTTYKQEDVEAQGLLTDKSWQAYQDDIKRNRQQFDVDENFYRLVSNGTGIDREKITILHYENPIFVNKVVEPINFGVYASIGTLVALLALLALSLIKKTKPEELLEVEPELSVEDMLVSSKQEPEKQQVAEIDIQEDSELKKSIDKFVEEKPEAVAQLLRNWLSDEWE